MNFYPEFIPKAPLFRDPIYDGCSDPVIIWNRGEQRWWLLYTSRRAYGLNLDVSFAHGTAIGVASSCDGRSWEYRGTLDLEFEPGQNTFWAPEVIFENGQYHMFVSYVRGVPETWCGTCPGREILHYTSPDLWAWTCHGALALSSGRVIDACVERLLDGQYKLWYKDEEDSYTWAAVSPDLEQWTVLGPEITDCPHEGPNVFYWQDRFWMVTDPWHGLAVYSSQDAAKWERRSVILQEPGTRPDDGVLAAHADVLVTGGRAYIFYFTHPEIGEEERNRPDFSWGQYPRTRCSIQVAELILDGEGLTCDRNNVRLCLVPPEE